MTDAPPWSYLMDLGGALLHDGGHAVQGADAFLDALRRQGIPYLVLTNKSAQTPRDLRDLMLRAGLDVPEQAIWTSALATAQFLDAQRPNGTANVIGEAGLTAALHEVGYVLTDHDPDYVVLGETRTYSFAAITTAIRLIERGTRFLATNPDERTPAAEGTMPSTGAVAALITRATGRAPYFVGKPNPLMLRSALRALGAHSAGTVLIGDRMDTDVRCGLESGLQTILVLSGISGEDTASQFAYRPTRVIRSVAELADRVTNPFDTGGA